MSKAKILIVEDEPKVAMFLQKGLQENDFEADIALDGFIGLKLGLANSYDLFILDVNLPEIKGDKLCAKLRQKGVETPVLFLSALGTTDDKLCGFENGGDDYLVKPFEFSELLARIYALLKRASRNVIADEILTIADLEINVGSRIVKRSGIIIQFTSREYSLLEFLMRNKNRVLSRSELAEKIWAVNFDTGTNVIDVYINFLRKKVDKDYQLKLIHTVVGAGYILKETNE